MNGQTAGLSRQRAGGLAMATMDTIKLLRRRPEARELIFLEVGAAPTAEEGKKEGNTGEKRKQREEKSRKSVSR